MIDSEWKLWLKGHLAGSTGRAHDSWSQGHESEPQTRHGAYFKEKKNCDSILLGLMFGLKDKGTNE